MTVTPLHDRLIVHRLEDGDLREDDVLAMLDRQ